MDGFLVEARATQRIIHTRVFARIPESGAAAQLALDASPQQIPRRQLTALDGGTNRGFGDLACHATPAQLLDEAHGAVPQPFGTQDGEVHGEARVVEIARLAQPAAAFVNRIDRVIQPGQTIAQFVFGERPPGERP